MTSKRSLAHIALVTGALASAAVLAAPSASAAGTYRPGDKIHSILTWQVDPSLIGGTNCIGFTYTRGDGAVQDNMACGGVVQLDQIAVKGHWVGIEPKQASATAIACDVYNETNGQTLRQNSHYWEKASISGLIADAVVTGSVGTPPPLCLVQLN